MERRDFFKNAGCGFSALTAGVLIIDESDASEVQLTPPPPKPQETTPVLRPAGKRYSIEVEIFEVKGTCGRHKAGDKFVYPQDKGKICAWLMDAMNAPIRVLECGGIMPWLYKGTPYEKVIDPEGITTEFIQCPDPTAGLVAKIIRRRV